MKKITLLAIFIWGLQSSSLGQKAYVAMNPDDCPICLNVDTMFYKKMGNLFKTTVIFPEYYKKKRQYLVDHYIGINIEKEGIEVVFNDSLYNKYTDKGISTISIPSIGVTFHFKEYSKLDKALTNPNLQWNPNKKRSVNLPDDFLLSRKRSVIKKNGKVILVDRTTNEIFFVSPDTGIEKTVKVDEEVNEQVYCNIFQDSSSYSRYHKSIKDIPVKLKPAPNVFLDKNDSLYIGVEIPYSNIEVAKEDIVEYEIKKGDTLNVIDRKQAFFLLEKNNNLNYTKFLLTENKILPNDRYPNFIFPPFYLKDSLYVNSTEWTKDSLSSLSFLSFYIDGNIAKTSALNEYPLPERIKRDIKTPGKGKYEVADRYLIYKYSPTSFDYADKQFISIDLGLNTSDKYCFIDCILKDNILKFLYTINSKLYCAAYDFNTRSLIMNYNIPGFDNLFTNQYQTEPVLIDNSTLMYISSEPKIHVIDL